MLSVSASPLLTTELGDLLFCSGPPPSPDGHAP
jgi:hypothetical protein